MDTKFKKGGIPWNKGLTKKIDSRVDYKRPTVFKKGERRSIKTEFKQGEHRYIENEYKKGHIPWCQGIKRPEMSERQRGKNNPMWGKLEEKSAHWVGDNVGYSGVHGWVRRQLGTPTKCEHCNKDGLTGRKIGWANVDHTYKRNLDDWIRLCPSCHRKYDYKYNLKPDNKIGNNQFTKNL